MRSFKAKYHSTKTQVGNILFASKKEALRYGELIDMSVSKAIYDLEIQPKFILIPKFGKERQMSYVADFLYLDAASKVWVVEDVKGFKTEKYRIKKKLFLYQRYSPTLFKFGMYRFKDDDFDLLDYAKSDDSEQNFRFEEV